MALNRYKIKRKWGRRLHNMRSTVRSLSSVGLAESRKRDFAWGGRNFNPHVTGALYNWRLRVKIVVLSLCTLLAFSILLFHPVFAITLVDITGLQRIQTTDMTDAVKGIANRRRWFMFQGENFFIIDIQEIRDIIKARFPIQSIIVRKSFPNKLSVVVEEKISTVIYDNGKQYSYLDLGGRVVEKLRLVSDYEWKEITEIVSSTNELGEEIAEKKIIERNHKPDIKLVVSELGDYPVVYDQREKEGEINEQVLPEELLLGVIEWFNHLTRRTDIPLNYFIVENELGDVIIKTKEGWEIKARLKGNIERQFVDLTSILNDQVKRPNFNYIDLRYEGRVYWQ